MSTVFYTPVYKIEFWSGSTKLYGFGYGYDNKEVVSFRIKPGLTKALGSFEITIADTGSNVNGISSGSAFKNIEVFSTVKMWYGYTGSGLTPQTAEMFVGKIDTKEISYGESGCYRSFTGRDLGEPLQRILQRRAYTGSFSGSANSLKNAAGLSSDNQFISGSTGNYYFIEDNTSCFDGLIEISDFDNKDFYVGTGSELHWFPRQSYVDTSGVSFEEGLDIFSYRYVKDLADVKNDYYVFGIQLADTITGSYRPIDGDDATENYLNYVNSWTAWYKNLTSSASYSGTATGSVIAQETIFPAASGSHYIQGSQDTSPSIGTEYIFHTFFDWQPTTTNYLMLNGGDFIHCYLSYVTGVLGSPLFTKFQPFIRLYSITTGSDYFECFLEHPGIAENTPWSERNINCGPQFEGFTITGSPNTTTGSYRWSRNGNPDWYSIRYVDFGVNYIASTSAGAIINVDGYYFGTKFQYHTSGSASINAYGLRTEVINDTKINSNLYVQNVGNILLIINQNPATQIEIKTITRPYVIGTSYPVIINSEGINSNFELIDLEHNWSNNTLTSKCLFTNQAQLRIPIPILNYPVQQTIKERNWLQKLADMTAGLPTLVGK